MAVFQRRCARWSLYLAAPLGVLVTQGNVEVAGFLKS